MTLWHVRLKAVLAIIASCYLGGAVVQAAERPTTFWSHDWLASAPQEKRKTAGLALAADFDYSLNRHWSVFITLKPLLTKPEVVLPTSVSIIQFKAPIQDNPGNSALGFKYRF